MILGDQTAEGSDNAGSNFALNAFSATGITLGTWLPTARPTPSTARASPSKAACGQRNARARQPDNLAIPGGNPGDVLDTNGAGVMSFAARVPEAPTDGQFYSRRSGAWAVAPGGMTDAPNDGTAYARKSQAWSHLTHADITDWAANVPASSSANPLVNGVAAPGSSAAFSRGDHVHPTDTSRAAVAALPPASTCSRRRSASRRLGRARLTRGPITFIQAMGTRTTTASSMATCGSTSATMAQPGRRSPPIQLTTGIISRTKPIGIMGA